jgi:hypothetical protein
MGEETFGSPLLLLLLEGRRAHCLTDWRIYRYTLILDTRREVYEFDKTANSAVGLGRKTSCSNVELLDSCSKTALRSVYLECPGREECLHAARDGNDLPLRR